VDPKLADIVRFLSEHKVRATYGAVAEVLGVLPRSMGARLGPRNPQASWVVRLDTGMPSGYSTQEMDPELTTRTELIRNGAELARRMKSR
jgi:hypothetical protein